ncbi:hypothetical protein BGY98DRAFT_985861 [Russula aff. rugulosa BPL654]|nr:hypothetical protein BGY98DRAFT_985861 [Russula aff. rugulosa BPL654]
MAMVMSESADATGSTSMLQLCIEGYVNTPELSAGRGGGLSQGLPANGPYKSVFRAGSRSRLESRASASNHHKTNAATAAPASSLHVVAEAAQSPEALSPTSVPTSMKRSRMPSPLIASTSPVPPLAPLDPISAIRSSPVASSLSQSHIIINPSPLCVTLERNQTAVVFLVRASNGDTIAPKLAEEQEQEQGGKLEGTHTYRYLSYDHAEGDYFPS